MKNIKCNLFQDVPLVALANVLHRSKLYNDAVIVNNMALDISPNLVVIHFTMANIYAAKVSFTLIDKAHFLFKSYCSLICILFSFVVKYCLQVFLESSENGWFDAHSLYYKTYYKNIFWCRANWKKHRSFTVQHWHCNGLSNLPSNAWIQSGAMKSVRRQERRHGIEKICDQYFCNMYVRFFTL